ncbi:MAG: extracellular solute-binding protein [Thermoproteota archaeon]
MNKISRRKFIGALGAGAAAVTLGGGYLLTQNGQTQTSQPGINSNQKTIIATPKNPQNYIPDEYFEFIKWLETKYEEMEGKNIRVAVEAEVGPRALFSNRIDFESTTGLKVNMEFDIFQQNLAKTLLAVSTQSPTYDVINIDVSQIGRFAQHVIPVEELMSEYPELTYPQFKTEGFAPPVWAFSATYPPDLIYPPWEVSFGGAAMQIPQETPIMMRFYRKDLFDSEGRDLAGTWDEYIEDLKHFHEPERGRFGTVLMAARYYSIVAEWHNYLYSYGGKLWNIEKDGTITSDIDSDKAIASLERYVEVSKYAEPNSKIYGWGPAAESIATNRSVMSTNFTEFAASMDLPGESVVIRKIGFAKNPKEEVSSHHYSGAGLAIPRYSRNPGAAWLFIQWATLAATQTLVAMDPNALGTPTRMEVFQNPEVKRIVNEGTIRHFKPVEDILKKGELNVKPGFPSWDRVEGLLMTHLNNAITLKETPREALKAVRKALDEQDIEFKF